MEIILRTAPAIGLNAGCLPVVLDPGELKHAPRRVLAPVAGVREPAERGSEQRAVEVVEQRDTPGDASGPRGVGGADRGEQPAGRVVGQRTARSSGGSSRTSSVGRAA